MDREKAYDRVDRSALLQVLRLYGVGGKLLRAFQSFYEGSKVCVRIGNEVSERFSVKVGDHYGCYYLYMDWIMREMQVRTLRRGAQLVGNVEEKWEVSQLLFDDDTVLVGTTRGSWKGWRRSLVGFLGE